MAGLPPLMTQSGGLHPSIRPQPQRPPPPRQTKPAVAGQAEFVTCDQTIERTINRLKQWRRVATRYEKREANYLAMVTIAAIVLLWLE
jgi:transposase